MFSQFVRKQMGRAEYKILKDGLYFGEIPQMKGVWASAKTLEDCRAQLQEILEDWALLKIRAHESIPGFRLSTDRRRMVKYA